MNSSVFHVERNVHVDESASTTRHSSEFTEYECLSLAIKTIRCRTGCKLAVVAAKNDD